MNSRSTFATSSLPWWRDGDRWIVIYLWLSVSMVVAGGAVIALMPAWVEAGLLGFDDRWTLRLERGEALVAAGQYERAVNYLQQLEQAFPARSIKHKRDIQRERLLVALSDALLATGRQGRSIDALERLAAYDPNNVASHYRLGCALRVDRDEDAARLAFENVLRIAPYHLAAARQLMEMAYEGGRFASVVETWDRYLNATRFAPLAICVGEQQVTVDVPADGSIQAIGLPLNLAAGFVGEIRIGDTESHWEVIHRIFSDHKDEEKPFAVHSPLVVVDAWLAAPRRFGQPGPVDARQPLVAAPDVFRNRYCVLSIGPLESGAATLDLTVRMLVTVDAATWDIVERAHRNVLAFDALEAARSRIDIQ